MPQYIETKAKMEQTTGKLPASLPDTAQDKYWVQDAVEANAVKSHFVDPSDNLAFTDYAHVGTHNSYSYPQYFKFIRNQDKSTLYQLMYGVRCINLDIYDFSAQDSCCTCSRSLVGPEGARIAVSHNKPGSLADIIKGSFQYQSFQVEMRRVIEFMRAMPKAIVTITLEDYVDSQLITSEIAAVIKAASYDCILRPADVDKNAFPTLGWMRKNNKRLVIFAQNTGNTTYAFHRWSYFVENQYSTTDKTTIYKRRGESTYSRGPFVGFNYFPDSVFTPDLQRDPNSFAGFDAMYKYCSAQGFATGLKLNVCFLDRTIDSCDQLIVEGQKTVFDYMNKLNTDRSGQDI